MSQDGMQMESETKRDMHPLLGAAILFLTSAFVVIAVPFIVGLLVHGAVMLFDSGWDWIGA